MAKLKHQAIGNYAWMRIIERADLPQQVKVVAFIIAINANQDGSNARVGEERLADTAICDERYAQDSVKVLRLLGLLEVIRYGRLAGDANTYQLTTPGGDLPAVPMRRDRDGKPINADGSARIGKRPKPPSTRPLLATLEGQEMPDRPMPKLAGTGNPLPVPPVDNSDRTGNPLPLRLVKNPELTGEYRQPVAATETESTAPYRQRVADVSATGCGRTGNPLPPTNSYQLLPTNSPQATQSPTANDQACGKPEADADPEYDTAHAALAAIRPAVADAWRRAARAELEAAGTPLTKRTVEIRAADLATHPTNGAATA